MGLQSWTWTSRRNVVLLGFGGALLLVQSLVASHVISSWWTVLGSMWRWRAAIVAGLLFAAAAVVLSRREDRERDSAGKKRTAREVTVAAIAALAVLVSGGVTAWVSWQSNVNTLRVQENTAKQQQESASQAFLRDSRKQMYSDLLASFVDLSNALSKVQQAAFQIWRGTGHSLPIEVWDEVTAKNLVFSQKTLPLQLLGSPEVFKAANDYEQVVLTILADMGKLEGIFKRGTPAEAVEQARQLRNRIVGPDSAKPFVEMTMHMRADLGATPWTPNPDGLASLPIPWELPPR